MHISCLPICQFMASEGKIIYMYVSKYAILEKSQEGAESVRVNNI